VRTGSTVRYLAQDHLGSTAFVMNATGGLESHVRYYPYGMTWSQSSTPATDRLFTGHQQMGAKSGTYYANARFYNADIGRFPQADTYMPDMPEPLDLNRYAYAGNNPTNNIDPTGHFFFDGGLGCGLTAGCGSGVGDGAPVPRWDLPWLPLPAVPSGPVSGPHPCAQGIACCSMGGLEYVCGFWHSDGGGGGLGFLDDIFDAVFDAVTSECGQGVIAMIGLVASAAGPTGTAIMLIRGGAIVTSSLSGAAVSVAGVSAVALESPEVITTITDFGAGALQVEACLD